MDFRVSTETQGSYFLRVVDKNIDPTNFLSRLFKKLAKDSQRGELSFNVR